MTIYKGKDHNMGKLAIFLSRLNSEKQSHIGYCGTNSDEIQQTLREDFLEENDELSFMIAFNEKNEIIAAIGLDVDDDIAEVWGPFQISDEVKGNILWEELLKEYPQIHTFHFFINEVNSRQLAFAESIGAGYTGKHSILEITTDSVTPLSHEHSTPYSEESFEAFQKLHHETFPGTYYDAGTIVERLKRGHTLKLLKAGDHHLQGYAYFEIDTDYNEGSIEYIAIDPSYRGLGLGTILLKETVAEMFACSNITDVHLCVNHQNRAAIHIYLKAGFSEIDTLNSYTYAVK